MVVDCVLTALIKFHCLQDLHSFLRLWYHESSRVFQDRLVNDEDRQWFDDLAKQKMKEDFNVEFDEVVTKTPLLYGDFMTGDTGNYEEVIDHEKVCFICL